MNSSEPAHRPPDPPEREEDSDPFAKNRPLDTRFETDFQDEVLRAAGAVILRATPSGRSEVALLRRRGTVCLPRVLLHDGETTRAAATRAVQDQVGPGFECDGWLYFSQRKAELSGTPLTTDYWRAQAPETHQPLHPDCFWWPLAQAAERVDLPEERHFLSTMEDPLVQPQPSKPGSEAAPKSHLNPAKSPRKSHWAFDPHRSYLAEAIAAARASVESSVHSSDWRGSALQQLSQAEDAVQSGRLDAAQEALTSAWRLELESRSVSERRLITQLLRGDVRQRSEGELRDSLLTALQESPDAGTMALVRGELVKSGRKASQQRARNDLARLAQLIVTVPVVVAISYTFSSGWLDNSVPARGDIMPATLAFGLFGGLAWSLFRRELRSLFDALAPLAVGAGAAFIGLLIAKAGILTIGQDSAPWALCLSVVWGAAAAALLDYKRNRS